VLGASLQDATDQAARSMAYWSVAVNFTVDVDLEAAQCIADLNSSR
jgi:hypothetical protein